jgi:O-antigen ligase
MPAFNLQKNYKASTFLKLILFLFPFFLISGAFLPDLIISFLSLFFLFFFYKLENKYSLNSKIFFFFLTFYFYIICNSFFSFNRIISFQSSVPYIRMILFSFCLAYLLNNIKNLLKIILISLILSYIFLLADSIYQLTTGFNITGHASTYRISSFFGRKLVMGSFVSRTLPIALSIIFFIEIKYRQLLQIFIILVAGVLVYLSAERLAFAYYLITLIFFIILTYNKKNLYKVILLILFVFFSLYLIKPSSYERIITHTIKQSKTTNYFGFSYRHELHFFTALNLFNDSKLIGHGLKSFRFLCENNNYAPIKKIINDNSNFSPINGVIKILKHEGNKKKFLILDKNIYPNYKDDFIIFEEDFNGKTLLKLNDKEYLFIHPLSETKIDEGIYYYAFFGAFNKFDIKNNQLVSKGDYLGSSYEFLNGCNTHPHNIYLEFLSELGILGLLFLLVGLFFILFKLFIAIKNIFYKNKINYNCSLFFALLGIFVSIFPLFPSGSFFNNWLSAIFYFNFGFVLFFLQKK